MRITNKKEPWLLFLGDMAIFIFSLWLTLVLRFQEIPSAEVFYSHLFPFSILFVIWFIAFFVAGLYEKHTTLFKSRLPVRLLNTQVFNSFLAVVFFYFVPYFKITPKTILFIYLVMSLILVFIWRTYGSNIFGLKLRERAMIIGQGEELHLLAQEVNSNSRYGLEFVLVVSLDEKKQIDLQKEVVDQIYAQNISVVVIDLQNKIIEENLSAFYNLLLSRIRFLDMGHFYEEVFDRAPVSLLDYNWFLANVSFAPSLSYDVFKRATDIFVSIILGILSLVFYPFIILAIKLDDRGPIFIVQNRIGKNNSLVETIKFRTMSFNDNEEASNKKDNKITRVGNFLRRSRLDELPQMWNVLRGDLSLIGPRPELPALVRIYEKEIPYYNVRHLIEPGLSGWAQLYHDNHPHQGANIIETKNKLSYDLYYIKNRSLVLDLKIALKTIKSLLSRVGR